MPIFEYACKGCGRAFELLVRSDTRISCPQCGSENVLKKLSQFSARVTRSEGEGKVPHCHTGGCGCDLGKCGSGFCGVE